MALSKAEANSPGATKINQIKNGITEMPTTIGTKMPEIEAAMRQRFRALCFFDHFNDLRKRGSLPTRVAFTFSDPFLLMTVHSVLMSSVHTSHQKAS